MKLFSIQLSMHFKKDDEISKHIKNDSLIFTQILQFFETSHIM